jgi:hypothetical protein
MSYSNEPFALRSAIRTSTSTDKWAALMDMVGGNDDDAISALSGRPAGRLLLDAEIASKSLYAEWERRKVHAFEKLRAAILYCFESRRRSGLVLKGYTTASPATPIPISPDLPLEYDFATGTARSGNLKFHGITFRMQTSRVAKPGGLFYPAAAGAELENFCKKHLASASPVPAMDALWDAAKKAFEGKHVSRDRVRKLHRTLIPPQSRKSGPRK